MGLIGQVRASAKVGGNEERSRGSQEPHEGLSFILKVFPEGFQEERNKLFFLFY